MVYIQPGNPRTQLDPTQNIRIELGWLDFGFGLGPFFLTQSDLGWVWVPKENDWVNSVQPENIKKKKKKLKPKGPKSKPNLRSSLVSDKPDTSKPNNYLIRKEI